MKKILLCSMLVAILSIAKAQDNRSYGFRLGLTAHPNFGWVKVDGQEGAGFNFGFAYGLMGDFNFAEHYSFTTGLTITTMNGKVLNPLVGGTTPNGKYGKYKLQYIEIPLTLKLKTSTQGRVRGYGQFGLSNGFNTSAKFYDQNVPETRNVKDDVSFYRAGLIIGGGAEFDIDSHTSLVAGLTFNNGFTSFTTTAGGNELRNHYIALNLGIFF